MNIAFITKDYNIKTVDAGFTSVLMLAKELKKKGHNVVMISNRGWDDWYLPAADKKYEVCDGISIYRPYGLRGIKTSKWWLNPALLFNRIIAPALGVRHVQKKCGLHFDVIHGSSSSVVSMLSTILAGRFAKQARLVHSIRSESLSSIGRCLTSWLIKKVDVVVVPLQSLKNKLIIAGGAKEKIRIIRSAIDIESLQKCDRTKKEIKNEFGIKNGEKVIVYYGKIGYFKGVDVLLDAINYLPEKIKVKYLLFHPVIWTDKFRRLAKNNKNSKKISLIAKKISVPDILSIADVLVLPFRSIRGTEGNPLCLLEGMATKTPIITSDLEDLKEIVRKDKDVIMVPPEDPKVLAKTILEVLGDKRLQKSLATHAYKIVQDFSIKKITEKYIKLYN